MEEVLRQDVLDQEPRGAGPQRVEDVLVEAVVGEDDDVDPVQVRSAAMRRVASMPSTPGIWMSMRTRSGKCALARARPSLPSAASATTSMSSSSSRRARNPLRIEWLVVDQQDADHDDWSTGSSASTLKPPSVRGSARRLPPRAVTRSRIPSSPTPGRR